MRKNKKSDITKKYPLFITWIKRHYLKIVLGILLVIIYVILYKIYMPRTNAFGCFDDCNNFMGGYFLLQGKRLFSEIFFNHNPFMAYISWVVQVVSNPVNLYELILRHRQSLFLFGFLFNLGLLLRFGLPAFVFTVFYELTKFYLFGDRFLAESYIVYPLVYMVGLSWLKLYKRQLFIFDYVLAGIFVWFVLFMREPYVPIALALFTYLLWSKKEKIRAYLSLGIFIVLSVITLAMHDIPEFFFNVVTTNISITFASEANSIGLGGWGAFKIFFYPVYLFFGGEWGHFRHILVSLNALFLISSVFLIFKKQWKFILFLWITLGLLNIRYVDPGLAFYRAFHLMCWYAVFLFSCFMMLAEIYKSNKKAAFFVGFFYGLILFYYLSSPLSFLNSKPSPHEEFITNYGVPLQVGLVVNALSKPADNLFLDGFDDIIYWQSKRFSSYKYSWYTSLMPSYRKYTDARIAMFKKSPPEFYYGTCTEDADPNMRLPEFIENEYIRLFNDKKPSCLWIHKAKLPAISKEQWQKAGENHYFLSKPLEKLPALYMDSL